MAVHEHEWQFDALDLPQVIRRLGDADAWLRDDGLRISSRGSTRQVDVYLDTADRRFQGAGYALRVRRVNRRVGAEATLKSLDSERPNASLRSRRELSQEVGQGDPAVLAAEEGRVGERVRAVAGRDALVPLFEVRTRRHVFSLEADGEALGEIAVDQTRILPPGGPAVRLRRVELEAIDGAVSSLEPFAEKFRAACGLRPADLTKYEAGLLAAGLTKVEPAYLGPTEFDREATIGAVAAVALRRQLSALLEEEAGTRLGEDAERLHAMRVASRRLRAALSLFFDVLPPKLAPLRKELRWIGGFLGAVRDLDVQLDQLERWRSTLAPEDARALGGLVQVLAAQRAEARARMLDALDSPRYESFVDRFTRILRSLPETWAAGQVPARDVAPVLIEARMQALREAAEELGPDSEAGEYHRLRIKAKQLRYALEFFGDLYPVAAKAATRRLVGLQDLLGRHQDADIAIARLRALADEHGDSLGHLTVFAMGEIAERLARSMSEARAGVPDAMTRVRGKSWKALRKDASRLRRDAAGSPVEDPPAQA